VVEAAAARRIVVAGPYPILAEIQSFGVATYDLTSAAAVVQLVERPDALGQLLDANEAAVRNHFDLAALPSTLVELAAQARLLAGGDGLGQHGEQDRIPTLGVAAGQRLHGQATAHRGRKPAPFGRKH
jgi:hypothetical protein